jgi:hypothetical protein
VGFGRFDGNKTFSKRQNSGKIRGMSPLGRSGVTDSGKHLPD